jgi:hypothetical protein
MHVLKAEAENRRNILNYYFKKEIFLGTISILTHFFSKKENNQSWTSFFGYMNVTAW